VLGSTDLPDFLELTARNPVVNAFAEYRARSTHLEPRVLAGEIWGRYDAGQLVAACHVGANLVPVECNEDDARAFAERALTRPRSVVTIVGPQDQVWPLWDCLSDSWGPSREARWDQPHLELARASQVAPDPAVRQTTPDDFDALYPACVDRNRCHPSCLNYCAEYRRRPDRNTPVARRGKSPSRDQYVVLSVAGCHSAACAPGLGRVLASAGGSRDADSRPPRGRPRR